MAPLLPAIAVMALIAGAVYLFYTAWTNNWGGIQQKTAAVWAWLQPVLQNIWNWLQTNIPIAVQAMGNAWNTISPQILTALRSIGGAIQSIAGFWTNTLWPAMQKVWNWMSTVLFPFYQALANFWGAVFGVAIKVLAGLWQNILAPALLAVWNVLSPKLMPTFKNLTDFWNATLFPIVQLIAKWIGQDVTNAFNGLSTALSTVTGWLNNIADTLNNLSLPSWMTPGSPTPWEIGLMGVRKELKSLTSMALPKMNASLNVMPVPALASVGAYRRKPGHNVSDLRW